MSSFRVRLTKRAFGHQERIDAWWRENRPSAPDLFETEVVRAFARLGDTPFVGVPYERITGRAARRLLLTETQYHIYLDADEDAGEVLVLAIWHASCGRPPPISGP